MASRTAKVASSIVAGFLASAPLSVHNIASAAECLTTPPRQDAPQGQHWYYHIDHANNKRHCWYLREEGQKTSQVASSDDASQAPVPAAQTSGLVQRSLEDARAEFAEPQPSTDGGTAGPTLVVAPSLAPTAADAAANPPQGDAQGDAQGSAVASRWPSQTAAAPSTPATPNASGSAEPAGDDASPPASPAPPSAAVEKPSASLQMLFAAIIGALALAGLTASIVYRLGRGRRFDARQRRTAIWDGLDSGPRAPWVEPEIEQTMPRPLAAGSTTSSLVPQERYEKIEEILAQLVRQAQQSDA